MDNIDKITGMIANQETFRMEDCRKLAKQIAQLYEPQPDQPSRLLTEKEINEAHGILQGHFSYEPYLEIERTVCKAQDAKTARHYEAHIQALIEWLDGVCSDRSHHAQDMTMRRRCPTCFDELKAKYSKENEG